MANAQTVLPLFLGNRVKVRAVKFSLRVSVIVVINILNSYHLNDKQNIYVGIQVWIPQENSEGWRLLWLFGIMAAHVLASLKIMSL